MCTRPNTFVKLPSLPKPHSLPGIGSRKRSLSLLATLITLAGCATQAPQPTATSTPTTHHFTHSHTGSNRALSRQSSEHQPLLHTTATHPPAQLTANNTDQAASQPSQTQSPRTHPHPHKKTASLNPPTATVNATLSKPTPLTNRSTAPTQSESAPHPTDLTILPPAPTDSPGPLSHANAKSPKVKPIKLTSLLGSETKKTSPNRTSIHPLDSPTAAPATQPTGIALNIPAATQLRTPKAAAAILNIATNRYASVKLPGQPVQILTRLAAIKLIKHTHAKTLLLWPLANYDAQTIKRLQTVPNLTMPALANWDAAAQSLNTPKSDRLKNAKAAQHDLWQHLIQALANKPKERAAAPANHN